MFVYRIITLRRCMMGRNGSSANDEIESTKQATLIALITRLIPSSRTNRPSVGTHTHIALHRTRIVVVWYYRWSDDSLAAAAKSIRLTMTRATADDTAAAVSHMRDGDSVMDYSNVSSSFIAAGCIEWCHIDSIRMLR